MNEEKDVDAVKALSALPTSRPSATAARLRSGRLASDFPKALKAWNNDPSENNLQQLEQLRVRIEKQQESLKHEMKETLKYIHHVEAMQRKTHSVSLHQILCEAKQELRKTVKSLEELGRVKNRARVVRLARTKRRPRTKTAPSRKPYYMRSSKLNSSEPVGLHQKVLFLKNQIAHTSKKRRKKRAKKKR